MSGQEWRAIVGNFSEFYARGALDWVNFTEDMKARLTSPEGLPPEKRWEPRCMRACVFCARKLWSEELHWAFLAGKDCFMHAPSKVMRLLSVDRYHDRWPLIPLEELQASAVALPHGEGNASVSILLHKRRVNDKQAAGEEQVCVCSDCFDAFRLKVPKMCKYALANDLWLGRWDPLFRKANLTHQMLLALARMVATKVVLRPEGNAISNDPNASSWDFLFHQSGMIGSAVAFRNAECKTAMGSFPPKTVKHAFAVSFVTRDPELEADEEASTEKAKVVVSKIAKLMVDRSEFDEQAAMLQDTNCVYRETEYDKQLVASWVPDPDKPIVPSVILDRVVAVPCEGDPGAVVASGPADATAAGEADRADADLEAARQARVISALDPDVQDFNENDGSLQVASLMRQLEDLQNASRRSVAAELESALENGAGLIDEAGRERTLQLCKDLKKTVKS